MLKYLLCAIATFALVMSGGSMIIWNIRTAKEDLPKKQIIKVNVITFGLTFLIIIGTMLVILALAKLCPGLW